MEQDIFLLQMAKQCLKLKFTAYVSIIDLGIKAAGGQKEEGMA